MITKKTYAKVIGIEHSSLQTKNLDEEKKIHTRIKRRELRVGNSRNNRDYKHRNGKRDLCLRKGRGASSKVFV